MLDREIKLYRIRRLVKMIEQTESYPNNLTAEEMNDILTFENNSEGLEESIESFWTVYLKAVSNLEDVPILFRSILKSFEGHDIVYPVYHPSRNAVYDIVSVLTPNHILCTINEQYNRIPVDSPVFHTLIV
jgi:hypothetical protein